MILLLRGGICLKLLGIRERYALKELVYKGMMSSGTTNDILTGDELFFAYMQATNYRKNNRKKPIVKN